METLKELLRRHGPSKEIASLLRKHISEETNILDSFKSKFGGGYDIYVVTNEMIGKFVYFEPKFPQWWHGRPRDPFADVRPWKTISHIDFSNQYKKVTIMSKDRNSYIVNGYTQWDDLVVWFKGGNKSWAKYQVTLEECLRKAKAAEVVPDQSSGGGSLVEQLRQLAHLRASGDISDSEFAAAKKRLLGT